MILVQRLEKAVNGYWDGGAKSVFDWKIEKYANPGYGKARVGSWGANHYFTVKKGKTDKQTLSNAKRHLKAVTRVPCTFDYLKGE
jgi:hypothetical protein